MARSLLNEIKAPGHRNFKVPQPTLQILRGNDVRACMPTRVRQTEIDVAVAKNRGQRIIGTWREKLRPLQILEGMGPGTLFPERPKDAVDPFCAEARPGVLPNIVPDLVRMPVQLRRTRCRARPPFPIDGWCESSIDTRSQQCAPIRIKTSHKTDAVRRP